MKVQKSTFVRCLCKLVKLYPPEGRECFRHKKHNSYNFLFRHTKVSLLNIKIIILLRSCFTRFFIVFLCTIISLDLLPTSTSSRSSSSGLSTKRLTSTLIFLQSLLKDSATVFTFYNENLFPSLSSFLDLYFTVFSISLLVVKLYCILRAINGHNGWVGDRRVPFAVSKMYNTTLLKILPASGKLRFISPARSLT
jgi:hypothetical protein